MKRKNEGITLLALIITIIIMLILAVVTLNLVGDGGILDKTENAVKATISAEAQEDTQLLISGLIMKYHQEVDVDADGNPLKTGQEYIEEKFADGQKTSSGKYFVKAEDGAVITFEGDSAEDATQENKVANGFLAENGAVEWHEVVEIPSELNVGDYVTYAPSGTYTWEAKYASSDLAVDGTADVALATGTAVAEGSQDMSITSWKVLSINEVTGDIQLVPSKQSSKAVRLQGAQGYNNGVKLLNDACSSLYGDSEKGISARSINIEDIERKMTPEALAEAHSYNNGNATWGTQTTNPYTVSKQYPTIYAKENLSVVNEVKNTAGLGMSDQTALIGTTDEGATDGKITSATSIQPYQTYWTCDNAFMQTAFKGDGYNLLIPSGTGTGYWVASRCVFAYSGNCHFSVSTIYSGYVGAGWISGSSVNASYDARALFPVVSLNASLVRGNDTDAWEVE